MIQGVYTIEEIRAAFILKALDVAVENNYLGEIYVQDRTRVKVSGNVIE